MADGNVSMRSWRGSVQGESRGRANRYGILVDALFRLARTARYRFFCLRCLVIFGGLRCFFWLLSAASFLQWFVCGEMQFAPPPDFCTRDAKLAHNGNLHRTVLFLVIFGVCLAAFVITLVACVGSRRFSVPADMHNISGIYYSNWSVYGPKHCPSALDVDHLTHVFYAFLKIDPERGTALFSDPWADLEMPVDGTEGAVRALTSLKQRNPELKIVASIGGWGTAAMFQQVVGNTRKQRELVRSVLDIVSVYGFDGLDVDWEYPSTAKEGEQLTDLLRDLRHGMNKLGPHLSLSVASPASPEHLVHYPLQQMDRYLSFWNVMGYDFFGASWSPVTGHHSNLYGNNEIREPSASLSIQYYLSRGIPPQKLVLGMPLYARTFYQPEAPRMGVPFTRDSPYESDIVDYVDVAQANEQYDEKKVAAFRFDSEQKLLYTYDNVQCAREKARFVRQNRLRGGFWWDSKGEAKEEQRKLVRAFASEFMV